MNHWMWPVSLVGILSTAVVCGTDMFFLTIGRPALRLASPISTGQGCVGVRCGTGLWLARIAMWKMHLPFATERVPDTLAERLLGPFPPPCYDPCKTDMPS